MLLSSMMLFTFSAVSNTCSSSDQVIDLDVDSDSNDGYDMPERSEEEDAIEEEPPGKLVLADSGFVPLVLEIGTIPGRQNVSYKFEFPTEYVRLWRSLYGEIEVLNDLWYEHTTWILGDMNGDGALDSYDIDPFIYALGNKEDFMSQVDFPEPYNDPDIIGDMNGDGFLNSYDIDVFMQDIGNYCYRHVPLHLWIEGLENSSSEIVMISAYTDFNSDGSEDGSDQVRVTVYEIVKPKLVLDVPTTVDEGENFQITVTADNMKVDDVKVEFNDQTKFSNSEGIVSFIAPSVASDIEYIILASKENYSSVTAIITVLNIPNPAQLDIDVPLSVQEGDSFNITVTADGQPVDGVTVKFNDQTKYTSLDGTVSFFAPSVNNDTIFGVSATKQGYLNGTTFLTVLDQIEITNGWIYGVVSNRSGIPLNNVQVCAVLSEKESLCTFTDQGNYILPVSSGIYSVRAIKQGYTVNTISNIIVEPNSAIELNLALERDTSSVVDNDREFIEYTIPKEDIGARISVDSGGESIFYYSDRFTIVDLTSTEEMVSFTIGAESGTSATIIMVNIGEHVLSDLKNLVVTYDGENISEFTDVEAFFDLEGNNEQGWLQFPTKNKNGEAYIFLRALNFSQHTFTISSIVKEIGIFTSIVLYVVICTIAGFAFLSRVFTHPVYHNYFRKKRK